MNTNTLKQENRLYQGSGGISQENRQIGFAPAFFDSDSRTVYPSSFADGRPAPIHMLDGLPQHLVVRRNGRGVVTAVKASVVAGFVRDGLFYTRAQAAGAACRRCLG